MPIFNDCADYITTERPDARAAEKLLGRFATWKGIGAWLLWK